MTSFSQKYIIALAEKLGLPYFYQEKSKNVTLDTTDAGTTYQLVNCEASQKLRSKLETLGLVPGERIRVIQKTGAGLIIEVKKSRLAIAHDLAHFLCVAPVEEV